MVSTNEKVKEITHIYDKIMKRILTLSGTAVINLINGLFNTSHPTDAPVLYHWTEHTDDDLNRTIADTILTIDHIYIYHMEAQMYQDDRSGSLYDAFSAGFYQRETHQREHRSLA